MTGHTLTPVLRCPTCGSKWIEVINIAIESRVRDSFGVVRHLDVAGCLSCEWEGRAVDAEKAGSLKAKGTAKAKKKAAKK
jgi:hypothetical protein